MRKLSTVVILSLLCLFIFNLQTTFAASTTMSLSPQSGSYGKPFTVDLVIDGHGDKFNAAQAVVTLSPNLKIQDLVLGDCNFSFLTTPSLQDPSFAGVILSTSATKCTVYSLTLVPVAKGDASIALTKATVRRFGDAANVLSSTTNGTYTLTAALKAPVVFGSQTVDTSKNNLYTVNLNVLSQQNTPVTSANVTLVSIAKKTKQQAVTNTTGTVHFSNLQSGIYDATIEENGTKVGENIINVNGVNHVLTLGINLKGQQKNPLMKTNHSFLSGLATNPIVFAGILLLGIIAGVGISIFYLHTKRIKS